MSVRIQGLHSDARFAEVSLSAVGLWVMCLSWTSNSPHTDGFIDRDVAIAFSGSTREFEKEPLDYPLIQELLSAGLLEKTVSCNLRIANYNGFVFTVADGSYRIHQDEVYARDGHACVYCGSPMNLTLDHVVPQSRGGSHDPENLVTACRSCNSSKGAKTPEEWEASR